MAKAVRTWINAVGTRTALIEPGRAWENGDVESIKGKLRDELLTARYSTPRLRPRS